MKSKFKLTEEQANEKLSKSGYTVSTRPMDHVIVVGKGLSLKDEAISEPYLTEPDFFKGKKITPIEMYRYSSKMNMLKKPNGASDHHAIMATIGVRSG